MHDNKEADNLKIRPPKESIHSHEAKFKINIHELNWCEFLEIKISQIQLAILCIAMHIKRSFDGQLQPLINFNYKNEEKKKLSFDTIIISCDIEMNIRHWAFRLTVSVTCFFFFSLTHTSRPYHSHRLLLFSIFIKIFIETTSLLTEKERCKQFIRSNCCLQHQQQQHIDQLQLRQNWYMIMIWSSCAVVIYAATIHARWFVWFFIPFESALRWRLINGSRDLYLKAIAVFYYNWNW